MTAFTIGPAGMPCPSVVEKVLGLSLEEVMRHLPRLAPDPASVHQESGEVWLLGLVRVTLTPQRPRCMGALAIPRTRVRLELTTLSEQERVDFMARFDRLFFRAGG